MCKHGTKTKKKRRLSFDTDHQDKDTGPYIVKSRTYDFDLSTFKLRNR